MTDTQLPNPFEVLKSQRAELPDHISVQGLFTPEECQKIIDISLVRDGYKATVQMDGDDHAQKFTIRDSNICWLSHCEEYHWIFERICNTVNKVNREHFDYELDGSAFNIQLTKYGPGQHYHWHRDHGGGELSRRKLSCSIQLSDPSNYTGGELVIYRTDIVKTPMDRGVITIFPSWVSHQAQEVTEGERWALVVWFDGPPLR